MNGIPFNSRVINDPTGSLGARGRLMIPQHAPNTSQHDFVQLGMTNETFSGQHFLAINRGLCATTVDNVRLVGDNCALILFFNYDTLSMQATGWRSHSVPQGRKESEFVTKIDSAAMDPEWNYPREGFSFQVELGALSAISRIGTRSQ